MDKKIKDVKWKSCTKRPVQVRYAEFEGEIEIETLEGVLRASGEDSVLIEGVEGEVYPCKKDIFYKTYDYIA